MKPAAKSLAVWALLAASPVLAARPRPPAADPDVTESRVDGMRVIVKRVPAAEFVSANLYVLGGVRNWGRDDAGVERLALATAVSGGTETLDKEIFSRRLVRLGATLGAGVTNDYSVLRLKTLRTSWDESWPLLIDAFLRPALPPSEIELQRRRQLAALRHEEEEPDGKLGLLLHETLFAGHPYANRAVGTIESVQKLDAAQLRAHLAKLRNTARLVLVVVGDVEAAAVAAQAQQALGKLPRGVDPMTRALPALHFDKPRVATLARTLPTNYIMSTFLGPTWRDADYPTALVTMTALRWRLWDEVRTKRNLSYAPQAWLDTQRAWPLGTLYVTAVDPKTTMKVMLDEAARLQRDKMPAPELAGDRSVFVTSVLAQSETVDGQADLLGRAQLFGGDWRRARMLPEQLRKVDAEAVQAFAKKYFHKLQTAYLGNPELVDHALFDSF